MRFQSAIGAVAALAATAVTAAPVAEAASQYGSWALDYTWDSAANGWKQEKFSAVYSLDQTTATKTWTLMPGEGESTTVDPESFVASYDGSSTSLEILSSLSFFYSTLTRLGCNRRQSSADRRDRGHQRHHLWQRAAGHQLQQCYRSSLHGICHRRGHPGRCLIDSLHRMTTACKRRKIHSGRVCNSIQPQI